MKGFAFGQYYPARSVLHRLDPRAKVLAAVIYIVAAFLCKNTVSFGLLLLSGLILTTHHPSFRVSTSGVPALIIGSTAKVIPGVSRGPFPAVR